MTDRISDSAVTAVIAAAIRAPSVHNTQPWRWVVGEGRLDLYADRDRQLRVLDPTGRQLHISCGAALLHARVAAAAAGYGTVVQLLPDRSDADHLATVAFAAAEPDLDAQRLSAVIDRRHTQRDPFQAPLSAHVVEALRVAAATEHAVLHPVAQEDMVGLSLLLARADETERSDPAYREELARWVRDPGSSARDGVPADALPHAAPGTWVTALQPRDFHAEQPLTPGGDQPPAVEHPQIAVLVTELDDPTAWLHAGQALGRVLLELTDAGGAAQPLTQVLDMPTYRERVRRQLHLLGHPQMLLRLGGAATVTEVPRRPVEEVLTRGPDPSS